MLRGDHTFAMVTNFALPPTNGNGVFTAVAPSETKASSEFQAICGHIAVSKESGRLSVEALPPSYSLIHAAVDEDGLAVDPTTRTSEE